MSRLTRDLVARLATDLYLALNVEGDDYVVAWPSGGAMFHGTLRECYAYLRGFRAAGRPWALDVEQDPADAQRKGA